MIAVLSGLFIAIAGSMAIGVIFLLNLEFFSSVPWAVVPSLGFLAYLAVYLGGLRHEGEEAADRRAKLRAAWPGGRTWAWSLTAIVPALLALRALAGWLGTGVEAAEALDAPASLFPRLPLGDLAELDMTIWALFVVNYLLAAPFLEEAAFRGYMQVPIEKRFGAALAIPLVATVFALLHLNRGYFLLHWVLALFLGALAWRAGSILPAILAHMAVNLGVLLGEPWMSGWKDGALEIPALRALETPWAAGLCAAISLLALVQVGRGTPSPARTAVAP